MRAAKEALRHEHADIAAVLRSDANILGCVGGIANDTERVVCVDEQELFQTLIDCVRTMVRNSYFNFKPVTLARPNLFANYLYHPS